LRSHPVWLQANSVIDSIAKPLLTVQVAFCRLDRNVAQQKLNLLQFTASLMAQAGACASEIVRRESRNLTVFCLLLHDAPDDLGAEAGCPDPSSLIDRAKESASGDSVSLHPRVNSSFYPVRNRNCSNVAALADKIGNNPALLPLLDIFDA
jgi:hypothetical protein